MSEIKVNKITPKQNCTQVTLGDSGDTFVIPSGVTITNNGTQTGFGRTGTVNWDTTAKTASFTAVSGNGYFVNTTSGAITVTLPATPSAGDIVAVADYANTFATNNLTVANNGSPINGLAFDYESSTNGISLTFVYVDGTRGWKNVNDGTTNATGLSDFIVATGGTITCCGDYKIHTFTGPGTFTVISAGTPAGSTTVDYLVVAGGGSATFAGGGGAGGYRESSGAASGCYTASPLGACVSALPVSVTGYPVTVGAGGAGTAKPNSAAGTPGNNGSNSIFSTITSTGGGWGGVASPTIPEANSGNSGGSGGGGGAERSPGSNFGLCGSAGNTPPVNPPQGNSGGKGSFEQATHTAGGGGGGAGGAGSNSPGGCSPQPLTPGGAGGPGVGTAINPSPSYGTPGPSGPLRYFAGGGRGGTNNSSPACDQAGSVGGGGAGNTVGPGNGTNGTTNTGGGAGGGGQFTGTNTSGGSGIVIIRYKFQ